MGAELRAEADLPVDDRLCVALGAASRAMTTRYRELLAPLGLTYPQYLVMSWLWQDGALSVSELSERMGLDPSTMSPLVKRLEAAGLTSRGRQQSDERRVVVSLTDQGRELRDRARHVPDAISAATGLSVAAQRQLVGELQRLTEALSTGAVPSVPGH